jgi:hypothetical protein
MARLVRLILLAVLIPVAAGGCAAFHEYDDDGYDDDSVCDHRP